MESYPVGRPTKYKEEYCEMLIEYMSKGMTFTAFASQIGVCRRALYKWLDKHPEFVHAKNIGSAKSEDYMLELAHSQMIDGKLNNTAWIFMMKNMHGWRDKQEQVIEQTVTVQPIEDYLKQKENE